MVADDGLVKVLDFGVAKLADREPVDSDNTGGQADDRRGNRTPGSILGTFAYMSPEQVEAKPLDGRSNIFSFGLILYEMVTGKHPFRHGSSLSTVSAILNDSPKPFSDVRIDVPRDLEKIIARCLRKDPNARWQDMADLRVALSEVLSDLETDNYGKEFAPTRLAGLRSTTWRSWIIGGLVLSILFVAGLIALRSLLAEREPEGSLRTVPLTSYPGNESQPAFSPDGKQIAFVWDGEAVSGPHIYVKLIDYGAPLRLTANDAPDCCPLGHRTAAASHSSVRRQLASNFCRSGTGRFGTRIVPKLKPQGRLVAGR